MAWRPALLPPNPPPTNGVITRTLSPGSFRACISWSFSGKGVWVDAHTVTLPFSTAATAECVSIAACAT